MSSSNRWASPVVLLVAAGLLAASGVSVAKGKKSLSCEELVGLGGIPDTTIESAVLMDTAAGATYCKVLGHITPEPKSRIRFVVNLPEDWNRRFVMIGDGGHDGSLSTSTARLDDGYATSNTDMGHDNSEFPGATFAYDQPDLEAGRARETDYGWRAVHLTVVATKEIIAARYHKKLKYSYFDGCSTGGREAHMEVQRFPQDFDGVADGAAAFDLTGLAVEQNWSMQQTFANSIGGKVDLLAEAVMDHCDGIDGLVDGLIDDPRQCDFDPASLLCGGGQDPDVDECLSQSQVDTVQAIYDGPSNSSGSLYRGKPKGSENTWALWIIPPVDGGFAFQGGFVFDFMNYLFFEDDPGPGFDWQTFDFENDPPLREFMAAITDATDPDISAFTGRGGKKGRHSHKRHGKRGKGKYILYHGFSDGLIPPFRTIEYYEDVVAEYGGSLKKTQKDVRLFLAPGMNHCGFPPGGLVVSDWLAPLVDWVEHGKAPKRVIATQTVGASRTRPLCPYPQVARWTGNGSIDDAANFECRNPQSGNNDEDSDSDSDSD